MKSNSKSFLKNKAVQNRLWLIPLAFGAVATVLSLLFAESKVLYAIVPVLLLSGVLLFLLQEKSEELYSCETVQNSKAFGVLLLAEGIVLVVCGVLTFSRLNELLELDRMLATLQAVFGLMGGALTVGSAARYLAKEQADKIYATLLVGTLWFGIYALVVFKGYSTVLNTPWQMLHVFALLCAMVFWLEMARILSGVAVARKSLSLICTATVGQWVFLLSNLFEKWTAFSVSEIFVAVLSLIFAIVIWRGRKG